MYMKLLIINYVYSTRLLVDYILNYVCSTSCLSTRQITKILVICVPVHINLH